MNSLQIFRAVGEEISGKFISSQKQSRKKLIAMEQNPKGRILAIDTGSTSTKLGYFVDGQMVFENNLVLSAEDLAAFKDVMAQDALRRDTVREFMRSKGIHAKDVDIIMARGGLFYPVVTGIYAVNEDMREVLRSCKYGRHACNLSAIIADDLAKEVTEKNLARGVAMPFGACSAYVVDPPMADEMLPECRVGGLPEFQRKAFFHALNSRAVVRRYLRDHGHDVNDITAIVAHIGGGITVTLHRNGKVIDTNNGVGGDGPFSPERVGSCPGYQLVDMCFSGKYTKEQVKKKLMGGGGAMAFFGTNSLKEIVKMRENGDVRAKVWLEAFSLNIAKYIASEAADVDGKVDVVILTGGGAYGQEIVKAIRKRVSFIAPVEAYPGEFELQSLAEQGYEILAGRVEILSYDKNAPEPDPFTE
jgi:butyrate kinase